MAALRLSLLFSLLVLAVAWEEPLEISLPLRDLPEVSSSVVKAEAWLRTHVLSLYPSENISAIIVGRGVLCSMREKAHWGLVLPSVKNLQHSLSRWGLEREIMVSAAFSSDCHGAPLETLKPLLRHLRRFSLYPRWVEERETSRRRLASSPSPMASFSFVPVSSPSEIPGAASPAGFSPAAPPCAAAETAAAPAEWERAWCVAKPTAPAELLQDAMDYACGDGGAGCEEIRPQGSCFYPNNIISHASFAFNSYWQRSKSSGGSCDFNGLAALVNSDPSFLHCQYVHN